MYIIGNWNHRWEWEKHYSLPFMCVAQRNYRHESVQDSTVAVFHREESVMIQFSYFLQW